MPNINTLPETTTPHTPGPWRVDPLDKRTVQGIDFTNSWRNIVSFVHGQSVDGADANARLIAAAPELLEALHAVAESAQSDADTCCYCRQDVARHASGCPIPAAFSAIAKAEGRS